MREHPWYTRRATTRHHLWFRNLTDLHAITLEWLKELRHDRPAHFLPRGMSENISENLWMLDQLASQFPSSEGGSEIRGLDSLLDDTSPDDLLGRLEHTVWAVQGWTLSGILDQISKSSPEDRSAVMNQLEQSSWRAGRDCASRRWPLLSETSRRDLRGLLSAFHDSPLHGHPDHRSWIERRALNQEAEIELCACPHQCPYAEISEIADALCDLHAHWARGFAYTLNDRVSIEHRMGERRIGGRASRCIQRLHQSPASLR